MLGKNLGIAEKSVVASVRCLNETLANETVLYLKTRKAHWDVRGPQFFSLHLLLQEQYEKMSNLVDEVAERVRMLGQYPLGTAAEVLKVATLQEEASPFREARTAVETLNRDHEDFCRALREAIVKIETAHSEDMGTVDLLRAVVREHEKMAWMLGALLEGGTTRAPEA